MVFDRKKLALMANVPVAGLLGAVMLGTTSFVAMTGTAVAQSGGIDEVIVTARKRSESIQDVPVAVSALSPTQLERGNISQVQDIEKLVPNVEMNDMAFAGGALSASIRGLAFDDLEKSFEPTVGVVIDGVPQASNAGVDLDLFDLEAVEVLRGPQGTLFGRNTIGGVINIKRSKPTGEYGLKVQIGIEEDNRQDVKLVANMPLGDKGGVKIALRNLESDSFMYNVTRGETRPARDLQTASISVAYDFTDDFSAQLTLDNYNDNSEHNLLGITSPTGAFFALNGVDVSGNLSRQNDYGTTYSGVPFVSGIQGNNLTLNMEWDLGNYTLKSITSHQEFDELMDITSWGGPGIVFPVVRDQTYEQRSQEFQLISDLEGPLNYVVGLYYLETDAFIDSGPIQNFRSGQEGEAQALFGELNYDINELWSVTAGLRYTEEEKTLDTNNYASAAAKLARNAARSFKDTYSDDNLTHRLILQRETNFGMVYGSYSTGYRSGGWQSRGVGGRIGGANGVLDYGPYDAEEVTNFEIGMRSELMDNKLILNITAFMSEYEDKQENIVVGAGDPGADPLCAPTCTFVVNAGEAEIEGLELEGSYSPNDQLTFRAAVGILDAEYKEFLYNGVDVKDNARLIFAPELTASIGAEYFMPLSKGDLVLAGNFKFTDDYYGRYNPATYSFATGPDITVDSFEVLDLSATYTTETAGGQKVKLTVFGNDVLEEGGRIERPFDAGAFAFATPAKRRHFGMTVGFEF